MLIFPRIICFRRHHSPISTRQHIEMMTVCRVLTADTGWELNSQYSGLSPCRVRTSLQDAGANNKNKCTARQLLSTFRCRQQGIQTRVWPVHKMLVLGIANGLSIQGDSTNTSTTGWRSILNRPWREFRCRANMSHCPGLGGAGPDSLVVQYRWVFYRGLRNKASHSQSMHAMSRHDSSRRTSREKVCKFNSNNNNNNNNKAARWCRPRWFMLGNR